VWVDSEEITAIAEFLGEDEHVFVATSTRRARGGVTIREKVNGDCLYYDRKKGCTIYPVRPKQCRTWPFWESNLESRETWERTESLCPGSGEGELVPVEEILRRMNEIPM
jgi:Fe-S-cluster containining protein